MSEVVQSPARTVTEADVARFAELTGDLHPQHVDAAWAADSAFGERIAHGMLIASLAVGLVAFDPERVIALRRVRDLVFKRPVRLGDTIHVDATEGARRAIGDDTELVSWAWKIKNQHDQTVCHATLEVLWRTSAAEVAA